ncbi:MAG: MFS transporter [Vicinamibacterales bacterium]
MLNRLLARVGLVTPEQRAWAWYDWANSTCFDGVTAVFPSFFATYAAVGLSPAAATARFGAITTISVAAVAVTAPLLGALADYSGIKKRLLGIFMVIGVSACAAMVFIGEGDVGLASTLFFIGNLGISASLVFYDSLLPHVARPEETDRVSAAGYAMGYVGGGILLLVNLAWILQPAAFGFGSTTSAVKASFVSVAVWWAVFSLPLFRHVPEPPVALDADDVRQGSAIRAAFVRLGHTFGEIRRYRQAFVFFLSMLLCRRRHPDHHPHGGRLRRRDRDRPDLADRGLRDGAVPGHPVLVPLRVPGHAHRHQARHLHRHFRLRVCDGARLLHDERHPLLRAGGTGRHGAGRRAGAQPRLVRADDSGEQDLGVLRLLRRGRALRHGPGAPRLHPQRRHHRLQPVGRARHPAVLRHFGAALLWTVDEEEGVRSAQAG